MRDRARAVVIGGGVGWAAPILYWLARLGWDDVVLVERADLTSGSTFHSAGLVGQLRSSLCADEDDDGERRAVPRARGGGRARDRLARGRLAPARVVARADGGDRAPGGLGEDVRASARARLGEEAQALFPPMSTDGVLGAAFLPTDGYIDPSQLTFALAEGARRREGEIATGRA